MYHFRHFCCFFIHNFKYLSFWFCIISDNSAASLSTISNTFLSDFVSCKTILLVLYPQFQNKLSSSHFLNIVEMPCFRFYFAFNLVIYPWCIPVINCNDLTSYKVWKKYRTVCHSVYLPVFQHLHWKTIYSNQSCLITFGLSLYCHFCNPKQVVGKVGDILFAG